METPKRTRRKEVQVLLNAEKYINTKNYILTMQIKHLIFILFFILIFSLVTADIVIPTTTKIYFEKNGKPYNGKIEFTIRGYGYNYPVGPPVKKEPGTYIPYEVYSFSETYDYYGDTVFENYYGNYTHIDYYEIEGKTEDGKTFIIKNLKELPQKCTGPTAETGQLCELRVNLDEAEFFDDFHDSASVKIQYETLFMFALALTILVESAVAIFVIFYFFKIKNIPLLKIMLAVIVASGLTMPYVWFIFPAYFVWVPSVLIGEAFAILVETPIYSKLLDIKLNKAALLSLAANIASFIFGILVMPFVF